MTTPKRTAGRPRTYTEGTRSRTVRLALDVDARVQQYAKAHGMTYARAVNVLLAAAV